MELLYEYIHCSVGQEMEEAFGDELCDVLKGMPAEKRSEYLECFGKSEWPSLRGIACHFVAEYASIQPAAGFRLWRRLAGDADFDVWEAADQALLDSLGRIALDARGVALVIDARYEAERATSWHE
jgi:hypothetical protein